MCSNTAHQVGISDIFPNIRRYIESLSLSERNRQWLAGKLLENPDPQHTLEEPQEEYISKEEVLAKIDAGLKDMKAGRSKTYDEFMRDWDDEV